MFGLPTRARISGLLKGDDVIRISHGNWRTRGGVATLQPGSEYVVLTVLMPPKEAEEEEPMELDASELLKEETDISLLKPHPAASNTMQGSPSKSDAISNDENKNKSDENAAIPSENFKSAPTSLKIPGDANRAPLQPLSGNIISNRLENLKRKLITLTPETKQTISHLNETLDRVDLHLAQYLNALRLMSPSEVIPFSFYPYLLLNWSKRVCMCATSAKGSAGGEGQSQRGGQGCPR